MFETFNFPTFKFQILMDIIKTEDERTIGERGESKVIVGSLTSLVFSSMTSTTLPSSVLVIMPVPNFLPRIFTSFLHPPEVFTPPLSHPFVFEAVFFKNCS